MILRLPEYPFLFLTLGAIVVTSAGCALWAMVLGRQALGRRPDYLMDSIVAEHLGLFACAVLIIVIEIVLGTTGSAFLA